MNPSPFDSPVVVDGVLSEEKLIELLNLGTEYPQLDFKQKVELDKRGLVELVKDIGAFQVNGGYMLIGVNANASPTGLMDDVDLRPWDEANLTPKLLRYLPNPLDLRSRVFDREGHKIVALFIGRNPAGCAVFAADGTYQDKGTEVVKFRQGDVFWRDGTRSIRMSQEGLNRVFARRLDEEKRRWLVEQREIRAGEMEQLAKAYSSQQTVNGPTGSVSFDMDTGELVLAGLEVVRANNSIGLQHLLMSAPSRARALIERDEIEVELGDLLDKLFCLAATFLVYGLDVELEQVLATVDQIVTLGFADDDPVSLEYSTRIPPGMRGPRVWLSILDRAYALGALAVRLEKWNAVRTLVMRTPKKIGDYYRRDWMRHSLTMASRAQHLNEILEDGRRTEISLLTLSQSTALRLACLNPDSASADEILDSLAQFDLLGSLVVQMSTDAPGSNVRYPSFARFNGRRLQRILDLMTDDQEARQELGLANDVVLAQALKAIGDTAQTVGFRYNGFWDWPPVTEDFISANAP